MKTILVRIDQIGDLVSTLPVDQLLQDQDITWLINEKVRFVAESADPPRKIMTTSRNWSFSEFFRLIGQLRQFDKAIVFHAPWWISCALFLAGIPWRGGKRSQWHSYLFLNKSVRQSRKSSQFHEATYNARLIEPNSEAPILRLNSPSQVTNLPSKYYVVHPGMRGSARNVSHTTYRQVILDLCQDAEVLITGTSADDIGALRDLADNQPGVHWMVDRFSGQELISVLQKATAVVAPSTGVAHLAASTGTRTIALFSPIRVQSPTRWGPRGKNTIHLVPQVNCPAAQSCIGNTCEFYDCMQTLTPELIAKSVREKSETT